MRDQTIGRWLAGLACSSRFSRRCANKSDRAKMMPAVALLVRIGRCCRHMAYEAPNLLTAPIGTIEAVIRSSFTLLMGVVRGTVLSKNCWCCCWCWNRFSSVSDLSFWMEFGWVDAVVASTSRSVAPPRRSVRRSRGWRPAQGRIPNGLEKGEMLDWQSVVLDAMGWEKASATRRVDANNIVVVVVHLGNTILAKNFPTFYLIRIQQERQKCQCRLTVNVDELSGFLSC